MPGIDRLPSVGPTHRKLTDWVTGHLRAGILTGDLEPGAALPLTAVAERLGVSTTPVREALLRLEQEGLVLGDAHKSFHVAEVSLADISDFQLLHASIAGILAERAAELMTEEAIDELAGLDAEIKRAAGKGAVEDVHRLNYELHRQINVSANSPVLIRFLSRTARCVSGHSYPDFPDDLSAAAIDHAADRRGAPRPGRTARPREDRTAHPGLLQAHARLPRRSRFAGRLLRRRPAKPAEEPAGCALAGGPGGPRLRLEVCSDSPAVGGGAPVTRA